MNMAIARIILRYIVGAALMGNQQVGEMLAADPDVVMLAAGAVGVAVEAAYAYAKRKGLKT